MCCIRHGNSLAQDASLNSEVILTYLLFMQWCLSRTLQTEGWLHRLCNLHCLNDQFAASSNNKGFLIKHIQNVANALSHNCIARASLSNLSKDRCPICRLYSIPGKHNTKYNSYHCRSQTSSAITSIELEHYMVWSARLIFKTHETRSVSQFIRFELDFTASDHCKFDD